MNMNFSNLNISKNYQKQQGAALAVGLILLLIITLMGYTGMKGTMLQEKMAAGLHNRSLAHGGANSALRAGESFLYGLIENSNGVVPEGTPGGALFGIYSFHAVPGDPTSGINPLIENFSKSDFTSSNGTDHGFNFVGVTEQGAALKNIPEYMIAKINCPGPVNVGTVEFGSAGGGASDGIEEQSCFVVTGKSSSGDGNSMSLVQSMYTVIASSNPSQ